MTTSPRTAHSRSWSRHPSAVNTNTIRGRLRWLSEQAGARHADGAPLILTPHDCRRVFASEHLNAHTPGPRDPGAARPRHDRHGDDLRQALPRPVHHRLPQGHARPLHRRLRPDANQAPTEAEWAEFTSNCSLRDMGTHVCALPTGEHCPRGLVCLGCGHAQPKKSALPVFRRMLHSHTHALEKAREHGEPAGQIASRELEVERIRSAMQRAQELTGDAAEALEAAAAG